MSSSFVLCRRCKRDVWTSDGRVWYCRSCRKVRSQELKRLTWHRYKITYERQRALRLLYPTDSVQSIRLKLAQGA